MKKLIAIVIILLALGGFIYWFFHPNQQLKRKSLDVLDAFTIEEGSSSGITSALFSETLYANNVAIKFDSNLAAEKLIRKFLRSSSISKESLGMGSQSLHRIAKLVTHQPGELTVISESNTAYRVDFYNATRIKLKNHPVDTTLKAQTSFSFEKTKDGFRLTGIELSAP